MLVAICLFSAWFPLLAQNATKGLLVDESSGQPIAQAHIQNLSQQKFTVSNFSGEFRIPMQREDTLWISCVGYQSMGILIQDQWDTASFVTIEMKPDTVMLEEMIIRQLPDENTFKRMVLDYQPVDSTLQFAGMIPRSSAPNPLLLDEEVKSLGFALKHPFGFIYHGLSKERKQMRKLYALEQSKYKRIEANQKYNREYVSDLTDLKGDQLTNFMLYCDFDEEFLFRKTQFEISEIIKVKLEEFLAMNDKN